MIPRRTEYIVEVVGAGQVDPAPLARTVLDLAAEIESAEDMLKDAILSAVRDGDTPRIVHIVTAWKVSPASEVLAMPGLSKASGQAGPDRLDPCRDLEVRTVLRPDGPERKE